MGLLKRPSLAAGVAMVLLLLAAAAQGAAPEYQVKAAMLYKFAVFVEWPPKAFPAGNSPFVACVIGKDPFGPWLKREMGEAAVGTHPVTIRHVEVSGAGACHLVFVAASEKPRLQEVITGLKGTTALIVSDVNEVGEFCRLGGMISLVMEESKVRFDLNSKAIEKAGLKVDSKLKRVAVSAQCGEK